MENVDFTMVLGRFEGRRGGEGVPCDEGEDEIKRPEL